MTIREIEEMASHNWEEEVNWQYVTYRLNLALTGKKIRKLPDCVRNVKGLEILTLVDTELACLPESIGQLSNLQRLNLRDNQLKALPDSFHRLPNLNSFTFDISTIINLKKPLKKYTKSDIVFQIDGNYVVPPEQCLNQSFSEWKEEWLLELENVEHRMMLVNILEYERIMIKLGSVNLHREVDSAGNEMELHKIELSNKVQSWDEPEEDIVLLKVVCSSTGKIHILRVPPDMTNCEEARRWTLFDENAELRFVIET